VEGEKVGKMRRIMVVLLVLVMVTSCMVAGTVADKGPGATKDKSEHGGKTSDDELFTIEDFRTGHKGQTKLDGVAATQAYGLPTPEELNMTQLTNETLESIHPMFSPDGTKIAYMNDPYYPLVNRSIVVMDAEDGGNKFNVTNGAVQCAHLEDWSPDGTKILFRSLDDTAGAWNDLWVVNADGSGVPQQLTFNTNDAGHGGPVTAASFSPDGSKIVYTLAYTDAILGLTGLDLWMMDADGSNQTQLTDTLRVCEQSPKWSPDGTRILYRRCMDNWVADIWVINADGSNPHVLVSQVNAQHFDWSPDGEWIVYEDNKQWTNPTGYDRDIYKARSDGSGYVTRLTPSDDYCEHTPMWSSTGHILFRSDVEVVEGNTSYSSTWVMDPDGSNKTMVNPWGGMWHDWSPDGSWIAIQTCETTGHVNSVIYKVANPLGPFGASNPVRGMYTYPKPDASDRVITAAVTTDTSKKVSHEKKVSDAESGVDTKGKSGHGGKASDAELMTLEDFRTGQKGKAKLESVAATQAYGLPTPEELNMTQLTNETGISMRPRFSPDGTKIAYMNDSHPSGNSAIWVMELAFTSPPVVVANYPVTDPAVQCARLEDWSPDGTKILFRSWDETGNATNNLWVVNADGSGVPQQLTFDTDEACHGGPVSAASFSPDGTKIAYTFAYTDAILGLTGSDLWVMDVDGTNQVQLTDTLYVCEQSPKWSPDGTRILYRRCMDNWVADIWVINADGSNPHVLVSQVNAQYFDWSPDGEWIVYEDNKQWTSPTGYYRDIYKARSNGSGYLTRLTPSDDYCEHTSLWGSDGTILYRSDELRVEGNTNYSSTWVMRPDGTEKTMINPWGGKWHDWSPSGEWIAVQTCEPTNGTDQIYIMRNPFYTAYSDIFDTGESSDPYPSIMGVFNGTLTPLNDTIVHTLYTYPCTGTGGHSESVRIWGDGIDVNATWSGYSGDWQTITFDEVTLEAGETYNITIDLGSYPQILHESSFNATGGTITCTIFVDVNGKIYYDWIPAIRIE
jgi:Tol biopolymer transport system component